MLQKRHLIVMTMVASLGCGDDLPDGVLETTALGSTSGADDTSGADETADETGTPENPVADGAPCDFDGDEIGEDYDFEAPAAAHTALNGELDCNFDEILENDSNHLSNDDDFDIWVYHPLEDEGWPEGQFPVVFMSPGGGQHVYEGGISPHRYLPMFEALARAGFVVIAIDPDDDTWSSGRRRAALACAMIWARDDPSDPSITPHLSDAMAILGHSRGGGAAYVLTRDILAGPGVNLPTNTLLDDWSQCALVTMAQVFADGQDQDTTVTNLPITDRTAPPFLALQGAIDEDSTNDQISAFDNRYSEEFIDVQTTQPDQNDELLLLIYGRSHNSWGGHSLSPDGLITPYYVPEFLRWQILGEQERRAMLVAPMSWNADSSSFPNDIAMSSTWTSATNDIYYSGCNPCSGEQEPLEGLGRPLIYANYTQGVTWNGASRFALDLLEEGRESGPYCEDFQSSGTDLPPSTLGGYVLAEATPTGNDNDPVVCEDSASSLLAVIGDATFDAHDTGAMLVQWGGALGGASVRWALSSDLGVTPNEVSTATHLSFRIGNVLTDDDASCDALLDEVTLRVELRHIDLSNKGLRDLGWVA